MTLRTTLLASLALASTYGCTHENAALNQPDLHQGSAADLAGTTSDGAPTGDLAGKPPPDLASTGNQPLQTVFLIVLENHDLSSFVGSKDAPYFNKTLLPSSAHATMYFNPPSNHPSEPNYLWLEAGDNLGVTNDDPPSKNHQATTDHLVTQLEGKGISWLSYQQDLPTGCPLADDGLYAVRHNPMVFFDDITNHGDKQSTHCIDHMRPYTQLVDDLAGKNGKTVARYNFITPNLCNDGHGQTTGFTCNALTANLVKLTDDFLAEAVPAIEASDAFKNGGVLFITWDEGEGLNFPPVSMTSDGPIGLVVDSPKAKKGYSNAIGYDHSSTLRTIQTIFDVPLLRNAATATDLSDLFTSFP